MSKPPDHPVQAARYGCSRAYMYMGSEGRDSVASLVVIPLYFGTSSETRFFYILCETCKTQDSMGHKVRIATAEVRKTGWHKACDNANRPDGVGAHSVYVPPSSALGPMFQDDKKDLPSIVRDLPASLRMLGEHRSRRSPTG